MKYLKHITKAVWILSIVSLLTDMASEMLYPVMPIYLKTIGFSVVLIGILEGIAEAIAGLSKGYFGKQSDLSGKRVPFVQFGYALSALAKPMLAFFTYPIWIFFVRTIDRFGKGIRTGARDALLSDEATPSTKGTVFGFHRSMDTFGAVLGPFIALLYLHYNPGNYIALFYIAFIPGLFAIGASLLLKDKRHTSDKPKPSTSFLSFLHYWKTAPPDYRKLVSGLLIFALVNSSDMFLLLYAKQHGISDTYVIGLYIFYNLIFSLFALPLGILADKIGLKSIFIFGLLLFAGVYAGMSATQSLSWFIGLFFLYGIYASATDGIAKAWISSISDKKETATAIGTYAGFQSICAMLSSTLTGLIWFQFGSSTAFTITALSTMLLAIYFIRLPQPNR